MAVPFQDVGFAPQGGERWEVNIGRERHANREYATFGAGIGNLGNPSRNVPARFAGGEQAFVESLRDGGANTVRLRLVNPGPAARAYDAAAALNQRGTRISTGRQQVDVGDRKSVV